jgi:hypothetical protein
MKSNMRYGEMRESVSAVCRDGSFKVHSIYKIIIVLSVFHSFAFQDVQAFEYKASGWIRAKQCVGGESAQQPFPSYFDVYVNGRNWLIRTTSKDSSDPILYREFSSDGKYMYSFGRAKNDGNMPDQWGGAVLSTGVPFSAPIPMVPVIWLGLSDASYIDHHSHFMIPPYSIETLRIPFEISVTRRNNGSGLPEYMVFKADGYYRQKGRLDQKWPPPYDTGFTNAIYSGLDFTNVGGVEVPKRFKLQVLRPSESLNDGNNQTKDAGLKPLALEWLYEGFVTNISAECTVTNFVPEIPFNSEGGIRDFRFAPSTAIVPQDFRYKSSRWLSMGEVRRLPGFDGFEKMQLGMTNFIPINFHMDQPEQIPAKAAEIMPDKRVNYVRLIAIGIITIITITIVCIIFARRAARMK